jgi:hypothetical protein
VSREFCGASQLHVLNPEMSRQPTILLALAIAILIFILPFPFVYGGFHVGFPAGLYFGGPLSVGWMTLVGYALVKHGRAGWPALLGAPLVFWWPFVAATFY